MPSAFSDAQDGALRARIPSQGKLLAQLWVGNPFAQERRPARNAAPEGMREPRCCIRLRSERVS